MIKFYQNYKIIKRSPKYLLIEFILNFLLILTFIFIYYLVKNINFGVKQVIITFIIMFFVELIELIISTILKVIRLF